MNLRQNGLVLILAAALLGIAGQWAGHPSLANLWALPLGLLLLGLAYERWVCGRAALHLRVESPVPWHLADPGTVHWQVRHRLPRTLTVMLAPRLPAGIDPDSRNRGDGNRWRRVRPAGGITPPGPDLLACAARAARGAAGPGVVVADPAGR
jgi:hypothetical protein